ncbi:MAG: hypoxanthine phosphoribosyltransferase [Thermodesulfobacteriota bacterium]
MPGNLKLIMPPEEIHLLVLRLAAELRRDYADKNPVMVGVMKGAFVFLADLMRAMKIPSEIEFIRAGSYGRRDTPSTEVRITNDVETGIKGRHVVLVEEIVDRGRTVSKVMEHLKGKSPASLKLCSLFMKRVEDGHEVSPDYLGAEIDRGFVVGYGLDYKEEYRYLTGLYVVGAGGVGGEGGEE